MSIAHDNTPRRGGARPLGGRDDGLRHDGPIHDGSDPDNAAHDPSGQTGSPQDDMLTVPIPARPVVTTFDAASRHERIEVQPLLVRRMRRAVTGTSDCGCDCPPPSRASSTGSRAWTRTSAMAPRSTLG